MKGIKKSTDITPVSKQNNGTTHLSGFQLFVRVKDTDGSDWIQAFGADSTADSIGKYLIENPNLTVMSMGIRELWDFNK